MVINNDFKLDDNFYHKLITDKKQILLVDSYKKGMKHYEDWVLMEGYIKRTAPFTVGVDGTVFQHYDSNYYSDVFGLEPIDTRLITVVLENRGFLTYNSEKKSFNDQFNDIYTKDQNEIFFKKWRKKSFWAPYSEVQIESLKKLLIFLCDKHKISHKIYGVDFEDIFVEFYNGIVPKHAYNTLCLDINPSLNLKKLK